jgi:hypothetical protein
MEKQPVAIINSINRKTKITSFEVGKKSEYKKVFQKALLILKSFFTN